jgi:uncharacterized cofD-like protein
MVPRHKVIERAQEPGDVPATIGQPLPRIVALGGGTGLPVVLQGVCAAYDDESIVRDRITAIVTMTDDGGSSGRLRKEFGMLPPGDVRSCLAAMAAADSPFRELLQHRFHGPEGLDGHPVGNLLLAALTQMTGDFQRAVDRLSDLIELRGQVLPSTAEDVRLRAEMDCGEILSGETAIVSRRKPIKRLSLDPSPRPQPEAIRALINADAIVVGPGSLYTSILPTLLVEGVAATISGVNAVRIYVANLMTEPGETDGYTLGDHLQVIRAHTGLDMFDYILVNRRAVDPTAVARYAEQGATPVVCENLATFLGRAQVVDCDVAVHCSGGKVRHDPHMLAHAINELIRRGRPPHRARDARSTAAIPGNKLIASGPDSVSGGWR